MSSGRRPLALVTGASAGLGAAFARAYAERGYDLALVARRADRLQALADELQSAFGVQSLVIPADLSLFEAHAPVLAAIAEHQLSVDVLVNNAGFGIAHGFVGVPWAKQRDFLMTMAVVPCGLAYGVIPEMLRRGSGAIINVSSVAAFSPGVAGNSLYPGVKSLMVKLSQSLDGEYRSSGLRITAVCPGSTKTEFMETAGVQHVADTQPRFLSQSAKSVVEAAIRGNERGRVVVVPGWHNKVAVALMKGLPEPLVRAVISAGSARYRLGD